MGKRLSTETRRELLEALVSRYRNSAKKDKKRILDEFVAVSGYHRKHATRLLSGKRCNVCNQGSTNKSQGKGRIYDEAVKEALIVTWEAADRICGKRLKSILPELVAAMQRHGHLDLDPQIMKRLLSVSAATIDRLLAPIHKKTRAHRKRRKPSEANKAIAVRTFADWRDPNPDTSKLILLFTVEILPLDHSFIRLWQPMSVPDGQNVCLCLQKSSHW